MINRFVLCLLCYSFLFQNAAFAAPPPATTVKSVDSTCPNAGLLGAGMIKYICWECVLPIILYGIPISAGNRSEIPQAAFSGFFCSCQIGTTGVYSEGVVSGLRTMAKVVEVVRNPHCSPLLGGLSLFGDTLLKSPNKKAKLNSGGDKQYYNANTWSFPLLYMIEALISKNCTANFSTINLVGLSTVIPTWSNDELALAIQPETAVFANIFAVTINTADGLALTASPQGYGNLQIRDQMFGVIGLWGSSLPPYTGNVSHSSSAPQGSALIAARALALEFRVGKEKLTMGSASMCGGTIFPMLPKTQYKISQIFPMPQAENNPMPAALQNPPGAPPACGAAPLPACPPADMPRSRCCNQIGESTLKWNEWRTLPGFEDYIYLFFRWTDCCVTMF